MGGSAARFITHRILHRRPFGIAALSVKLTLALIHSRPTGEKVPVGAMATCRAARVACQAGREGVAEDQWPGWDFFIVASCSGLAVAWWFAFQVS
jgi:hypothetical protein